MENQELLTALSAMLDQKLDQKLGPINERLEKLEDGQNQLNERMDAMGESLEEVRDSVNALLEWSETVGVKFDLPLRPAQ